MKYVFIIRHKKTWPVGLQCKVLGVSRNGYYSYQQRLAANPPDPERNTMLYCVKRIAQASNHTYGSRRMKKALGALGYVVSRSKARKLMREAGVEVRFKKRFNMGFAHQISGFVSTHDITQCTERLFHAAAAVGIVRGLGNTFNPVQHGVMLRVWRIGRKPLLIIVITIATDA